MRDIRDAALEVEKIVAQREQFVQQLADVRKTMQGMPVAGQMEDLLDQSVEQLHRLLVEVLQQTINFPPHHTRHFPLLNKFWADGSFERSVFVMSKFPDEGTNAPKDAALERVLKAVERALTKHNYVPRIARQSDYHEMLWDNVELHLIGCRQGIAIVEDRYLEELNPNVAMEWGWMRAMGKRVLFLVEKSFTRYRADVSGLSIARFDWNKPGPGVGQAVAKWTRQLD